MCLLSLYACVSVRPVCVPCLRLQSKPAAELCSSESSPAAAHQHSIPVPAGTGLSPCVHVMQHEPEHTGRSYLRDPPGRNTRPLKRLHSGNNKKKKKSLTSEVNELHAAQIRIRVNSYGLRFYIFHQRGDSYSNRASQKQRPHLGPPLTEQHDQPQVSRGCWEAEGTHAIFRHNVQAGAKLKQQWDDLLMNQVALDAEHRRVVQDLRTVIHVCSSQHQETAYLKIQTKTQTQTAAGGTGTTCAPALSAGKSVVRLHEQVVFSMLGWCEKCKRPEVKISMFINKWNILGS